MKILYITNGVSGYGGLERVLSIKTNLLIKNHNCNIHIITINQENQPLFYDFNVKIKFHNIENKKGGINYLIAHIISINDCINKIKPDIISVCDDGLKGLLLPKLIKKTCPIIYERHSSKKISEKGNKSGLISMISSKFQNYLMNFGAKSFDKFVVLTKGNILEWNLKNIEIIPNPLSFYPETVSNLKNKKVMTVGHHSYNKGYDRLLNAWKIVNIKHPDWYLDIYGENGSNTTFIDLCKKLNLNKCVNFHKPTKAIEREYSKASIYALPSRSEGFGMTLIEAMACGVPCVAFDCPSGPADIITNNEDGFLVLNNDIESFAEKINLLIENQELRSSFGKKGRKNIAIYRAENITESWYKMFHSLINKN